MEPTQELTRKRYRWLEGNHPASSRSIKEKKDQINAQTAHANMRLSPRDTWAYRWMSAAAVAKLHLGSYEEAVTWFRRAIEANRNYPHPNFLLAAALAQLGRIAEARSAIKVGLALNPTFTISRAHAAWTAMSDDPTYFAQLGPIFDGLRKAGVPEQ
jgi:Flp pilus assembly protein TadD